jgi:hypothetical protein
MERDSPYEFMKVPQNTRTNLSGQILAHSVHDSLIWQI